MYTYTYIHYNVLRAGRQVEPEEVHAGLALALIIIRTRLITTIISLLVS